LQNQKINICDRIEGDTIILYDNHGSGPLTLKKVKIIPKAGKVKDYEIKKTSKNRYLFN
jgi:hypothetical protein